MKKQETFLTDFDLDGIDDLDLDIDDLDENIEENLCIQGYLISTPKKFKDIPKNKIKAKNAVSLAVDLCKVKDENSFVNCLIPGDFVFCDLLSVFCEKMGGGFELDIATLSYSYDNVITLANMFTDKSICRLGMVISDYFYAHERTGCYRFTLEQLPLDKTDIAVAGVHTKIHLLKKNDDFYVLEGSANLRSSQNVEQFIFCKSKSSYEFHAKWIAELQKKYSVISDPKSKKMRTGQLWSFINSVDQERS